MAWLQESQVWRRLTSMMRYYGSRHYAGRRPHPEPVLNTMYTGAVGRGTQHNTTCREFRLRRSQHGNSGKSCYWWLTNEHPVREFDHGMETCCGKWWHANEVASWKGCTVHRSSSTACSSASTHRAVLHVNTERTGSKLTSSGSYDQHGNQRLMFALQLRFPNNSGSVRERCIVRLSVCCSEDTFI